MSQNHIVVSSFFLSLLWAPSFTGRRLETEALGGWMFFMVDSGIRQFRPGEYPIFPEGFIPKNPDPSRSNDRIGLKNTSNLFHNTRWGFQRFLIFTPI